VNDIVKVYKMDVILQTPEMKNMMMQTVSWQDITNKGDILLRKNDTRLVQIVHYRLHNDTKHPFIYNDLHGLLVHEISHPLKSPSSKLLQNLFPWNISSDQHLFIDPPHNL
jgi:hypothetical protein